MGLTSKQMVWKSMRWEERAVYALRGRLTFGVRTYGYPILRWRFSKRVFFLLIGAGFDVRNPQHDDVEDEIDIDGDDAIVFGDTQFTEKDIIFRDSMNSTEDEEVRVDSDGDEDNIPRCERVGRSLRDLVAQGKVVLKSDVEGTVATSAIVSAVSLYPFALSISHTENIVRIQRPWEDSCVAYAWTRT